MNDEPLEINSDNHPGTGPHTGTSRPRPRLDRRRLFRVIAVVWAVAMLLAAVIGAMLNFAEAARACSRGLGAAGAGWAEVTFRSSISVTCHARGGTFDIPMNGAAAVVLFGGLGLVGLAVAGLVLRIAGD
ncbi:hypothetical protein [Amycolatopsis jiangsuensis]|uniref:Uncharacterized protein n=1 Tax=Amycolatopsis jiangsuensis TaxID=1181879 RepID=A0A840IRP6_9PSEU|nr:hypothetical protein [Amycolatopsis jiangsuensis]MBB4684047.1 hypothetical protein [Amycolatopsis jiangsuensis]